MDIGNIHLSRYVVIAVVALVVVLVAVGLYVGGVFKGSSSSTSSTSPNQTKTTVLPKPATQKPTIKTGKGAAKKISGFKLSVTVSATPEIQSGQWAVEVNVQGGKNRSQTLGSQLLTPGKDFIISNNQAGAYTITPSILNCKKDCKAGASGYTLPPLTVDPGRNANIIITPKCVKSSIPLGIDCARSQVLSSYK
jgi:hypothetical protein